MRGSYGQQYTLAQLKAGYIFSFGKYITWENESEIEIFRIGVVGDDPDIVSELKNMSGIVRLKNKPVEVINFTKPANITNTHILYITEEMNTSFNRISEKIRGNNTLIVTDNYINSRSMINFVYNDDKKDFKVNEKNIVDAHLITSDQLVNFATSKTNWQELYIKSGKELQTEKNKVREQQEEILAQQKILEEQKREMEKQKEEIKQQQEEMNVKKEILNFQNEEIEKKQSKIDNQEAILNEQMSALQKQRMISYLFIALFIVISGLGYFIYRGYRIKKRSNDELKQKNDAILQQNEEILQQKEELTAQREMLQEINKKLEESHRDIDASIRYAKRIQQSILPNEKLFQDHFPESFILYQPKFSVSGDFYWFSEQNGKLFVAAVDCTGHGVPGAFMSMIGNALLNEIINEKKVYDPAIVLNQLHTGVISALHQKGNTESTQDDGMDITLCCVDKAKKQMEVACAAHTALLLKDDEIKEIQGDIFSIGGGIFAKNDDQDFTKHVIDINKDTAIYMFSDGFQDQFGGTKNEKFMASRFKDMVFQNRKLKMKGQYNALNTTLQNWKGDNKQIDDILVIGIKFPGI